MCIYFSVVCNNTAFDVFYFPASVKRPKGKDEEEKKSIKSLLTILLKRRPDMETLVARGIMEGKYLQLLSP